MIMLKLSSIMIGTMQIEVMAKFYEELFGKAADMVESGWHGWSVDNSYFMVGEHSDMAGNSKDAGRIMFNFETNEIKAEFDRIVALGAKVIKKLDESEENVIATLADPDGNYFQLMAPWK